LLTSSEAYKFYT